MSITRTIQISSKTLRVFCNDALAEQAEWLLNLLRRIESERGRGFLRENVRVQVGWSMLTIVRRGQEYVVCEPDFANDPFHTVRDDITCTLAVQAEQNDVLRQLEVEGVPVDFRDKIVLSQGCLNDDRIYLERKNPSTGDSGWYIGPEDQDRALGGYEAIRVHQLLALRPELMKVLALPVGYLVVFDRNRIEAILNERNEQVWRQAGSASGQGSGQDSLNS